MTVVSLNDAPTLVALRDAGASLLDAAILFYVEAESLADADALHGELSEEEKVAIGDALANAARAYEAARAAFAAGRDTVRAERARVALLDCIGNVPLSTACRIHADHVSLALFNDWNKRRASEG